MCNPRDTCIWPLAPVLISLLLFSGCPFQKTSRLEHYRKGGTYYGAGPSPSPDGKHILYSSPRTGNGDLYQVKNDGSGTVRLTTSPRYECDAEYSPDGRRIVFIREDGDEGNVWIMDADGTREIQLTDNRGDEGSPKFSPDGSQIIFWRTDPELKSHVGSIRARELVLIDVRTSTENQLTNNELSDVFPVISPDGKVVALERDHQIWIMSSDGTGARPLGPGSEPSFSPDGTELAIVSGEFGRHIDVLDLVQLERRTIYSRNTTVSHPVFLADGSTLLFLEHRGGSGVGWIMMVSLSDGIVKRVTHTW